MNLQIKPCSFFLFVDMAGLDRRLTGIFRASLPNDEGLSRILSPATLAAEAAGMTLQSETNFSLIKQVCPRTGFSADINPFVLIKL